RRRTVDFLLLRGPASFLKCHNRAFHLHRRFQLVFVIVCTQYEVFIYHDFARERARSGRGPVRWNRIFEKEEVRMATAKKVPAKQAKAAAKAPAKTKTPVKAPAKAAAKQAKAKAKAVAKAPAKAKVKAKAKAPVKAKAVAKKPAAKKPAKAKK
ncbi:hypothetical protein KJ590_04365, partial [Patescibacteria group bacterium]|nr:hypothetical protein [Patescibacteria group bacterium]